MRRSLLYFCILLLRPSSSSLPALFETPEDAVTRYSSKLELLRADAIQALPKKIRGSMTFSKLRAVYYSLLALEDQHPSMAVMLQELRDHGAFRSFVEKDEERQALFCLKALRLIVLRNGTISTRAWAYAEHIRRSAAGAERKQQRQKAAAAEAAEREKELTWHELHAAKSHPHPTKILMVTPKNWPGSTLLMEMFNSNPSATLFAEPCAAFERKLGIESSVKGNILAGGDGGGSPGSGHEEAVASTCLGLVLRALHCTTLPSDSNFLFSDKLGVSRSAKLNRLQHVERSGFGGASDTSLMVDQRHRALVSTCRASELRIVLEDRVTESLLPFSDEESALLAAVVGPSPVRLLHLIMDPRSLVATRLQQPPQPIVAGESIDEHFKRIARSAEIDECKVSQGREAGHRRRRLFGSVSNHNMNKKRRTVTGPGQVASISTCIIKSCESFGRSVASMDRIMQRLFGAYAKSAQGTRQFMRVHFEDLQSSPWSTLKKIYDWTGIGCSNHELDQWAYVQPHYSTNAAKYGHHDIFPWVSFLSERQQQLVTRECGSWLQTFGYASTAEVSSARNSSLTLPAWAWTTIPKRNLEIPVKSLTRSQKTSKKGKGTGKKTKRKPQGDLHLRYASVFSEVNAT